LSRGSASIGTGTGDSGSGCNGGSLRSIGSASGGDGDSAGRDWIDGRAAGALTGASGRGSSAEPGEVASVPGANLNPDPGSGESRRNVTSSAPSRSSPR